MNQLFEIVIQFSYFIFIFLIVLLIFNSILIKRKMKLLIGNINNTINQLKRREPKTQKYKFINICSILVISLAFFFVFYILIYSFLKLHIASFIFAFPFLFIPYLLVNYVIMQEKEKIKKILPVFAINLKSHVISENNIILAIRRTKIEGPLNKYIAKFLSNIDRGMNVYEAFNLLKNEVAVNEFSELILAFQICYLNGGKFANILELYATKISNSIIMREKEREKTLSSVITLIIMILLNLFLVFSYIFQNQEFSELIRGGIIGQILIDLNAISCVICVWFLIKMYKMEE